MAYRVFDGEFLQDLSQQAAQSVRLRKNHNLHQQPEDACQMLFNALEPMTYVRPHCHLDAAKSEMMLVVRGAFGILLFSSTGELQHTRILRAGSADFAIHIGVGQFHSMVSLEAGSVFFEAKAGPYQPLTHLEMAAWAPAEQSAAAADYLAWMQQQFS